VLGVMGCGKVIRDFGRIPVTAALDMGRALMRAHPHADAIFFPSPHWPVIEAIEALEREFGVAAMAASQACVGTRCASSASMMPSRDTAGCFERIRRADSQTDQSANRSASPDDGSGACVR